MNNLISYILIVSQFLPLFLFGQLTDTSIHLVETSKYSILNGLPSNNVYFLMQDQSGLIWASTDRGVSVFDGEEFTNFGTEDGLSDYEILSSKQDSEGKIWFSTFNGKVCYWENNKFFNIPIKSNIKLSGPIKSYFFINKKTYVVPDRGHGIVLNKKSEHIIDLGKGNYNNILVDQYNCKDELISVRINEEIKDQIEISTLKKTSILKGKYSFLTHYDKGLNLTLFKNKNDTSFIELFNLEKHKIISCYSLPELKGISPISIYQKGERLILGTRQGLYLYSYNKVFDEYQLVEHKYKSLSISCIIEIHDGTYLISSLEEGIKHLKATYFKSKIHNIPVFRLIESQGRFFSCEQGTISEIFSNDSIKNIECLSSREKITDIAVTRTGDLLISSGLGLFKYHNNSISNIDVGGGLKEILLENERVYVGAYNGIFWFAENDVNKGNIEVNRVSWQRTNTLAINDEKLLIGNSNGIQSIDLLTQEQINKYPKIKGRVNKLFYFDDELWIATANNGIWKISKNGDYNNYLTGKTIFSLHVVNSSSFWALTNNNICFYDQNKIKIYAPEDLSIDGKIEDLLESNGNLFVGTSSGLFKIPIKTINDSNTTIEPMVLYSKTLMNGEEFDYKSQPVFSYYQNNIEINFQTIYFGNRNQIHYEYTLSNNSTGKKFTSLTKSKKLSFFDLKPGNYTFKISANIRGFLSEEVKFSFIIKEPFYSTWWFFLLSFLLVFFSLTFYIRNKLKVLKNEQIRLKEIHKYKQKSLRAQMNPHFLFNVLNSIQLFFLNDNNLEGHKYLKRFAELVRLVLNNSEKTNSTLKEEVSYLERYVELEQLRSSVKFSFKINIKPEIDIKSVTVPTMIIQPFIENSIWHAFSSQSIDPEILISISEKNELLIIEISDNGKGFDQNKNTEFDENKNPRGLKLVEERILTLKKYMNKNTTLKIESIPEKGTFVKLKIPKRYD